MKFRTRRDPLFTVLGTALIFLLIGTVALAYMEMPENPSSSEVFDTYIPLALILLATCIITSMLFFTRYELTPVYLKYRSGIIYGKIKITRIREIIVGKTMHVGLKPATATKGLIIKYDKFEELYISPDSNESFTEAILKIKKDIIITETKH